MLLDIKKIIKKYQIHPLKRLGQNFLIDKKVVKKMIRAADLKKEDIVLEVGPGLGVLTQEIAKKSKKVIAVEKDKKLAEILKKETAKFKNIEIINENILNYNLDCKLQFAGYKVVANLPFYITSPAIRKFLEADKPPKEMVLIVQKEIAQRICACPPKTNFLAISVQFYGKPEIISYLSKKSFWPKPKVDSAIIKIIPFNKNIPDKLFKQKIFQIIKAGFSQPRKQLAGNLASKLKLDKQKINSWLLKNNIQPNQRAETLGIQDWIKLTKTFPQNLADK